MSKTLTVDTRSATELARAFGLAGFGTRQALVGPMCVVTLLCAPGVEIPVIFHEDGLPGLLFVSYRGDTALSRVDEVLERIAIEVRRISIREDEYRMVLDAIGVDYHELLEMVVARCCADDDRVDVENVRD